MVRSAGGAVSHLVALTSELIRILEKKNINFRINVIFAGKVGNKNLIQNVKRLDARVDVFEANIYKQVKFPNSVLFPALAIKKDGLKRFRELLKDSNIVISRAPYGRGVAIAYWLALLLAKPKDAMLVEEYFGNPYWNLIELDVMPLAQKLKASLVSLFDVSLSLALVCLFADKVFVISDSEIRAIEKETFPLFKNFCVKKMVSLYPPIHQAELRAPKKKGPFTFCTSGSFYPHQGYKDLAKLIYTMNELLGLEDKVKFKIMGPPIQASRLVKPLLEGFTNVEFGYETDRRRLYEVYASECDAFLALYDPFKVYPFYGAPAKLADFVLFNKPIIVWKEKEYLRTIEYLTEKCDCLRVVSSFEELVEEAVRVIGEREGCECKVKDRSRSAAILEEVVNEALRTGVAEK